MAKVGELRRAETDTTTSASPSTADEDHSMSYTRPDVPGGFWRTEVVSLLTMLRPLEEYTGEEKLAIEDVVQILEWMHAGGSKPIP